MVYGGQFVLRMLLGLFKEAYGLNGVDVTSWWDDGTYYIQIRDAETEKHITTYSATFTVKNKNE